MMSFFNLEVLKWQPTKSIWIFLQVKFSKNMLLGQKNWTINKIATRRDLWKYGLILIIQKSLIIKWLNFSKKIFFIWIYHIIIHHILDPNNKFGMRINIIFYILWCSNETTSPYFQLQKFITSCKWFYY